MKFDSIDEVLDYAIQAEQGAADFYTDLADRATGAGMKEVFLGFADEEKGHKAKLLKVKAGKQLPTDQPKVQDLKVAEYLDEVEPSGEVDYQQALIIAMKAEKRAFMLYSELATLAEDQAIKNLFLGLAQEEAKHKLRFEIEYDDIVLREN